MTVQRGIRQNTAEAAVRIRQNARRLKGLPLPVLRKKNRIAPLQKGDLHKARLLQIRPGTGGRLEPVRKQQLRQPAQR